MDLARSGLLTQKERKKVVKVCILQRNIVTGDKEENTERLFQHVMEIELDLKKE